MSKIRQKMAQAKYRTLEFWEEHENGICMTVVGGALVGAAYFIGWSRGNNNGCYSMLSCMYVDHEYMHKTADMGFLELTPKEQEKWLARANMILAMVKPNHKW